MLHQKRVHWVDDTCTILCTRSALSALKDGASGSSRAVAKAVVTDAATLLRETAGTFIASGDAKLAALRTLLTRCTRIIIGQHMDGAVRLAPRPRSLYLCLRSFFSHTSAQEVIFRSALTDVLAAAHDYRAAADNLAAAPWDSASLYVEPDNAHHHVSFCPCSYHAHN